jgi:hypothetical protein
LYESSRLTDHIADYIDFHLGRNGGVSCRTPLSLATSDPPRCMVASMDEETVRKRAACKGREEAEVSS